MTRPAPYLVDQPSSDEFVLAGRPLRPGVSLAETSRFGDDVWHLEPAQLQAHANRLTISFEAVPACYLPQAKQLLHAMLAGPPPPGERKLSPTVVYQTHHSAVRFLRWLHTRTTGRPRRPRLAELTESDLVDYSRHVGATVASGSQSFRELRAVRMFWRFRRSLTDPLAIDPARVAGWQLPPRRPSGENRTDRIPEQVLQPLISWALRFVDNFAADILHAHQRWQHNRAGLRAGQLGRNSGRAEELGAYLAEHVRRRQPLPGVGGRPNLQFIAAELGISGLACAHHLQQVARAAEQVGATDHTWLHTAIGHQLDDRPWITGIALSRHPTQSLRMLARLLQTSCWVLIAFLSGMRDSEIKHLRRGCVSIQRGPDGVPYRWKLAGHAFKGENDPAGVAATWVVGQAAARAVAVLEALQPEDRELLFSELPHGTASKAVKASTTLAVSTKATNGRLGELVRWVNNYCAQHGRTDSIPDVNGQPWTLTSRQFRRTLAWFIARRPGGSIAGAIQYRHQAIHMFEGYAGTSDSGFRAEVEAEQALARGEDLLTMVDTHEHANLTGPAAAEARRRLDELGNQARFTGTVLTDPHQVKRLLRRHDPAIYPGTFATCVFNPDKALCHKEHDSRGTTGPTLHNCRPLECANTALTISNITALRAELDHVTAELDARPSLPPLLQHRLRDRADQIQRFLDRHQLETIT